MQRDFLNQQFCNAAPIPQLAMNFISQILAPVTAALFALLIFLYCLSRIAKSGTSKRKIAPEPAGAWPVIGHLHLLGAGGLPHVTLGDLADRYGPAFTLRLGLHRVLVVSSWEVAKECYTTNDMAFSSRPKAAAVKHMGYNYAMFGFAPYGPYWRQIRKIATLELLSNSRLKMLKGVRALEVETCIRELYDMWNKNKAIGSGSVLVEMERWFRDLTMNMVVRMVAGRRYFGSTTTGDKGEAFRFQKAMRDFFHLTGQFVVSDALPFLGWLDLQGYEKEMKRTAKELDSVLQEWLEEHRRKILAGGSAKGEHDFMEVMLYILEDLHEFNVDDDTIIKSTCLSLILGGTDTTSVTLTWALSSLLNNPHMLQRAQEELDIHVGRDRPVAESDIKDMVYLQAIIKETLRLYPATPLSAPREAFEDCTVAGYHVAAGTRLFVNLWKIQRDPRVWSEPSEFRPERFLTSHKDVDVRGQHFELIAFGSGRRSCPGISFAFQVVHLTLARLLQGFDFATPSEAPVDMTESSGLTNAKATPLELLLTPRLDSKVYGY